MTLLQDGLIAFFSAVGVTTLVWICLLYTSDAADE